MLHILNKLSFPEAVFHFNFFLINSFAKGNEDFYSGKTATGHLTIMNMIVELASLTIVLVIIISACSYGARSPHFNAK